MVAKTETQILYKRRTAEILNDRNNKEKDLNSELCTESITTQKTYFNSTNNNANNNHNNEKMLSNDNNNKQNKTELEDDPLDITLPTHIGTELSFKRQIVWSNAIGFFVLHIMGFIGIFLEFAGYSMMLTNIYAFALLLSSAMGITMGAHRLFSHRTFKAKTWLKVTLIILHTLAGQNCLYVWVRDHRQHHKYSDTDADPHNATRGFFFSHIGWLMTKKHPKIFEYGKKIDMSDLEADPWVMFQKRHYKKIYAVFTLLLPTAIPVIFWNEDPLISLFVTFFARTIVQLNFTWSVNSVAHMFGNRPYDKRMLPVESKLVAILAAGEGWHNYHHTFPWDYRTSEFGMPWNVTTTFIDWLADKGQIYDRKFVSENMLKMRIQRTGDGTHTKYGTNGTNNMMPQEIPENELLQDYENEMNKTKSQDPLRKYIVDKKQLGTAMLDKLESCGKFDAVNNNDSTDLNGNMKSEKIKSKQMLNVST